MQIDEVAPKSRKQSLTFLVSHLIPERARKIARQSLLLEG